MSLQMEQEVLDQNLILEESFKLNQILKDNGVRTDKLYKPEKQITKQDCHRCSPREVKTDFACPESGARISVKAHSTVELCSVGMLQFCDYLDVSFDRLGYAMSESQSFKESLLIQPKRLYGDEERDEWNQTSKVNLNNMLKSMMTMYPELKRELVKTAMLGDGIFEGDAIPTHVATPEKFVPITREYIDKVTDAVKIEIRLKGRSKIKGTNIRQREPSFRIGLNMKSL